MENLDEKSSEKELKRVELTGAQLTEFGHRIVDVLLKTREPVDSLDPTWIVVDNSFKLGLRQTSWAHELGDDVNTDLKEESQGNQIFEAFFPGALERENALETVILNAPDTNPLSDTEKIDLPEVGVQVLGFKLGLFTRGMLRYISNENHLRDIFGNPTKGAYGVFRAETRLASDVVRTDYVRAVDTIAQGIIQTAK